MNITIVNMLFNSNPNFNNLYSNFSRNYSEPLYDELGGMITEENTPQAALNLLYGSDLDVSL